MFQLTKRVLQETVGRHRVSVAPSVREPRAQHVTNRGVKTSRDWHISRRNRIQHSDKHSEKIVRETVEWNVRFMVRIGES